MRTMTTKTPHPDFVLDPEQPIDAELPIEQAPAVMPEPIINPLFQNLVPDTPQTRSLDGKLSFADAMPRLGYGSVFDIIRQPKQAFARQVRSLSNADGEMAYDNAMCYATQIARSYREEQVSSGRSLPQIAPQTGVRALVDIGPSYPNLFKENWDQFCKVGAIEAMDGPVAYLGSLRRFAEQRIEGASTSPKRIPLAVRRPDLDTLVIDEQSTYQSMPMLDLVNEVLTQGIDKYQTEKGDARPVHQLLAEKKHPFVFPYHFAHQQVSLALDEEKPALGELNYRLSMVRGNQTSPAVMGNFDPAQRVLSGLSPALDKLVTAQPLFSHFYISLSNMINGAMHHSPSADSLRPTRRHNTSFLIQAQPNVESVTPPATQPVWAEGTGSTSVALRFVKADGSSRVLTLNGSSFDMPVNVRRLMHEAIIYGGGYAKTLLLEYLGNEEALEQIAEHRCDMTVMATAHTVLEDWISPPRQLAPWKFTFVPEPDYHLTPEEQAFFQNHYGVAFTHCSSNPLTELDRFLQASGLDGEQLEALLALKANAPIQSAHFVATNRATAGGQHHRPFPLPNHYGACYVNGVGGSDPGTRDYNNYDNSMGVAQPGNGQKWHLTNTSLERFDRLQRMVRLQKATGLPYAELDTLLIGCMRSEGDANCALNINGNTLRALGVYRYLNKHHRIEAEEFAAFIYHLSPYATTGKVPMLDQAFNTPVLFDAPLMIDDVEFSLTSTQAADKRTVAQLCAGLGVELEQELTSMVANTLTFVTPLKRSLAVVSSLYRQARIARMFGLSVSDCQTLLTLLGGEAYRALVASGRLKAIDAPGKDVLDILMELDVVVRWLKTNKLTVPALCSLLEADSSDAASSALLERLQQLATDAFAHAITPALVGKLDLPTQTDGAVIDWYAQLRDWALITQDGFVVAREFTSPATDHAQLLAKVEEMCASFSLAADLVAPTTLRLADWLMDNMTRQQRLIEGFLQEHTGLLPEQALLASHWAQVNPQALLHSICEAWPDQGEPMQEHIDATVQYVQQIGSAAQNVAWTQLGARALRTFLAHPEWLGAQVLWPQTLHTLHLLKAYESLFNTLGQPEERLLGYLELANSAVSKRPGKRQLAAQAEQCNAAAASLVGWSISEVAVLTAQLPQGIAKTVAHLDWLRRAQGVALQTGLNAAVLLQACALNADSPDADWQAVGQAAMAAVRA
jgi:hypothetical protein